MSTTKRILVYAAGLPVSFLLFATAWLFIAPRMLYHCWDDAPPFLISWMPPFIHPESNSLDGALRDYYRVPEWVVYTVWFAFIAGVFVLPALLVLQRSQRGVTRRQHTMKALRVFGFVVLALIAIFLALAAFGVETPSYFERAPVWLRPVLLIGACVYLVWWFIADFGVVRDWFRRGGPSQ